MHSNLPSRKRWPTMQMVNQQPGLTKQVLAASLTLVRVQQIGNKLRHQPRRSAALAPLSIAKCVVMCSASGSKLSSAKQPCWGLSAGSVISALNHCTVSSLYFVTCQLVHDSTRQHLQLWLKVSCIHVKMETCGLQGNHTVVLTRVSTY